MANTQNAFGFQPAEHIRAIHYYTKNTAATMYPGDMLIMLSTGKVGLATAGATQILGALVDYSPSTDTSTVAVYDDPDQEYYVQDDGVAATLTQTNVGNNFDLVATAGNATQLKSKMTLDTSDGSGSGSANLRLLGFHPSDTIGKYVRCRVVINEHAFGKTTTGV